MKDDVLKKRRFIGVVNIVYLCETVGIVPQVEIDKKQEHVAGFGCTHLSQFDHNLSKQFVLSISCIVCFSIKGTIFLPFDIPDKMKLFRTLFSSLPNVGLDASQAKARGKEKANMQECRSDVDLMQPLQRLM